MKQRSRQLWHYLGSKGYSQVHQHFISGGNNAIDSFGFTQGLEFAHTRISTLLLEEDNAADRFGCPQVFGVCSQMHQHFKEETTQQTALALLRFKRILTDAIALYCWRKQRSRQHWQYLGFHRLLLLCIAWALVCNRLVRVNEPQKRPSKPEEKAILYIISE